MNLEEFGGIKMKTMKVMYYINFVLLIVMTVIVYLYANELSWLGLMLLAYALQLVGVITAERKEKKKRSDQNSTDSIQ